MRIKLAGGVGEHGRNCFLIEGESMSFLVDCGVMEHGYPYPDLTDEEARRLSLVLLTHSHNDHSGALPWLLEKGFRGIVTASAETFRQLPFPLERKESISAFTAFPLRYGRTGHCAGSLWYHIEFEGKRLFFSGDYLETSDCYETDKARGLSADFAVLDAAYGNADGERLRLEAREKILSLPRPLALPVPKYGRGFEVLSLLPAATKAYADAHFLSELERTGTPWVKPEFLARLSQYRVQPIPETLPDDSVVLLSDPQLRKDSLYNLASSCRSVLLTGTVKQGSGSEKLLRQGKARLAILPVHSTDREIDRLEMENHFSLVVRNHTPEHSYPDKEIML